MERLTIRNSDGTVSQPTGTTVEAVFYRLADYEDTNREPAEVRKLEREYRTAVNELCYMCGKYKEPAMDAGGKIQCDRR